MPIEAVPVNNDPNQLSIDRAFKRSTEARILRKDALKDAKDQAIKCIAVKKLGLNFWKNVEVQKFVRKLLKLGNVRNADIEKIMSEILVSARTVKRIINVDSQKLKALIKKYGPTLAEKNVLSICYDHDCIGDNTGDLPDKALGIQILCTNKDKTVSSYLLSFTPTDKEKGDEIAGDVAKVLEVSFFNSDFSIVTVI